MDIRLPVGIFFFLVGLLLVVYGLLADSQIYQKSLGININLYWGILLCLFGAMMLLLGRRALREAASPRHSEPGQHK